jgi:hypothetical protein
MTASITEVDGQTAANFRFGSKADIGGVLVYVRFTPKSGHQPIRPLDQRARSMCREKQYRVLLLSAD